VFEIQRRASNKKALINKSKAFPLVMRAKAAKTKARIKSFHRLSVYQADKKPAGYSTYGGKRILLPIRVE
jgi:hypothetical protein